MSTAKYPDQQPLLTDLEALYERLKQDPTPGASAGRVVSHYAGLVSEALLGVENAIRVLKK